MSEGNPDQWSEDDKAKLRIWRQGDYTLDQNRFPLFRLDAGNKLKAWIEEFVGWVVVSQTCDIVNLAPGRDHVVVAPLMLASEDLAADVDRGTTAAAAKLENAPDKLHVVDLSRMFTLTKRSLLSVTRLDGFSTDDTRSRFAESLERRIGRFAFPDVLNPTLGFLRKRAKEVHGKDSDPGRVYASIKSLRVVAMPNFDAERPTVGFHVVIGREAELTATRAQISAELAAQAGKAKFPWPTEYDRADPLFALTTMDDLTAQEWQDSHHVDLDFISAG